jgi:hypothetical protein
MRRRMKARKTFRKRLSEFTATLIKVASFLSTLRRVILQVVVLIVFISKVWDHVNNPFPPSL